MADHHSEAHIVVVYTLEPQGGATKVKSVVKGPVPYFAKIIHMFINMDDMAGGDFEAGWASLKAITQQSSI